LPALFKNSLPIETSGLSYAIYNVKEKLWLDLNDTKHSRIHDVLTYTRTSKLISVLATMPTELGSSDPAGSGLNVFRTTPVSALTSALTPNSVPLSLFFSFNEFSTLSSNKKYSTDTQKLIVLYP
jgi:hypothetical protein